MNVSKCCEGGEDGLDECSQNHEEKSVQTGAGRTAHPQSHQRGGGSHRKHPPLAAHRCCPCPDPDDHGHSEEVAQAPANQANAHGSACMPVVDLKQLAMLNLGSTSAKTLEEAKDHKYRFWETQPVPQFSEKVDSNTVIEPDKETGELRTDSYSLPSGFVWSTVDINDASELQELYLLLNENYVEDDDNMFRFDYSPEFLKWALQPPGWVSEWHCGVRASKSRKLVGFIGAIPSAIRVYDRERKMVEINFLCVHKKLRSKRVAPVLIREITRRVNLGGIFQAVYTAGVILPRPVCTSRYWHRSLNPKKLIDVNFSHLGKNMTMQRTLKLYKLPQEMNVAGLRPMVETDVANVCRLINDYLKKFNLSPVFSIEDCQHWFLPRENVINSYIIENNGKVTEFLSFYTLPSTVVNHPVHKTLKAAYSFYNVSTNVAWADLMTAALIEAKNTAYDVFNALDLMDNKEFLEKLKFGLGDGNLQYYLFNWKCPEMQPEQVGLVLQ